MPDSADKRTTAIQSTGTTSMRSPRNEGALHPHFISLSLSSSQCSSANIDQQVATTWPLFSITTLAMVWPGVRALDLTLRTVSTDMYIQKKVCPQSLSMICHTIQLKAFRLVSLFPRAPKLHILLWAMLPRTCVLVCYYTSHPRPGRAPHAWSCASLSAVCVMPVMTLS